MYRYEVNTNIMYKFDDKKHCWSLRNTDLNKVIFTVSFSLGFLPFPNPVYINLPLEFLEPLKINHCTMKAYDQGEFLIIKSFKR